MKVSEETLTILDEIRKEGGESWEKLKAKSKWERMSLTAIIRIWGDPRKWAHNAEWSDGEQPPRNVN